VNFTDIIGFTGKPQIYAEGNAVMWIDERIKIISEIFAIMGKKDEEST
jgi:hypothetical protein